MKPRIRYCGGVWSCATYDVVPFAPFSDLFLWRIGYAGMKRQEQRQAARRFGRQTKEMR